MYNKKIYILKELDENNIEKEIELRKKIDEISR